MLYGLQICILQITAYPVEHTKTQKNSAIVKNEKNEKLPSMNCLMVIR